MEKIPLLILLLLFSFFAEAQIVIKTDSVEITLPKNTKKKDQLQVLSSSNGKTDSLQLGAYEIDGFFLDISHIKRSGNKNRLKDIKRLSETKMRSLQLMDSYYEGKIEHIFENEVLTMRIKGSVNNYYLFYVVNGTYTYEVNGMLQFDPGKEIQAKNCLNEILKGFKILI